MERIYINKVDFCPVKMHEQGIGYWIYWDYNPNSYIVDGKNVESQDYGTCLQVFAPYRKPTVNLIKYLINNFYNQATDKKIYDGFKWNGNTVYLTSENQFNYKAMYDMAVQTDGATLPVTFKVGNDEDAYESKYITFNTLEEFGEFYVAALTHIQTCINEGWAAKDAVDYSVFEEALKDIPDLPEDKDVLTNTL